MYKIASAIIGMFHALVMLEEKVSLVNLGHLGRRQTCLKENDMKKWIGILLFVLYAGSVVLIAGPAWATLIEITPTYGTAVIDGNISDWNLATDVRIPMYNAGKTTEPIVAYAYLRYDYTNQIMNVLVLQNGYPGNAGSPYLLNTNYSYTLSPPSYNTWAYLGTNSNKVYNDGNTASYPPNGTLPNIAWVGATGGVPASGVIHSVGYEAAFALPLSSLNTLYDTAKFVVHAEWDSTVGGTPTGGTAGSEGFANSAANTIVLKIPSTTNPVPLPASVFLLGSGLLGIGLIGYRRKRD
jgi:hypothetical protein